MLTVSYFGLKNKFTEKELCNRIFKLLLCFLRVGNPPASERMDVVEKM